MPFRMICGPHNEFISPHSGFVCSSLWLCDAHSDLCDLHNGILCTCSDLWALIMSLFINKMNEWHHSNSVWPSQWLGMPLHCICLTFTLTYVCAQWVCAPSQELCGYLTLTYMPFMTLAFFTLTLYDLHNNSLWGSQDLLLCSHNSKCCHNEYSSTV